ncbi:MAG: EAL domain-containing protein [Nitrospirae bacterium]|nr:EAL domain-containing protein [Nitrospirota bacterium]
MKAEDTFGQISHDKAEDTVKIDENSFRRLIDRNPVAMAVADKKGNFLHFNNRFLETFGYTIEDIPTVDDWWPLAYPDEEYRQRVMRGWGAAASKAIENKKDTESQEWRVTCKDGTLRDIEFRMASLQDVNIVIFSDITERKKAEEALLEQERYMTNLIQNSPMATFVLDCSHKIKIWNKACEELTGCKESEMLGTDYQWQPFYSRKRPTVADIILDGSYDKLPVLYKTYSKSALNPKGLKAEGWYNSLGGKKRYIIFEAAPIFSSKGKLLAAIETLQDTTESKNLESDLLQQALYDSLTGLPNRILLRDRIQNLYNHKKRQPEVCFAALFVDLDDFKKINDSLGHMIGDELLLSATKRLHDAIRPGDTISRFGGDEFVVLLDSVSGTEDAIKVAQRIHEVLLEAFHLESHEVFISSSIGIALSESAQDNPDNLLRNADIAMYCAKESGKSRYVLYDACMHDAVINSVCIENDLRKAVKMGEMSVHYQPIVDIRTNTVAGFEALARWLHPDKGYIPPMHFIPVAEKIGLIDEIGASVLKKACMDIRKLNSDYSYDPPLYVSVNLSARQFNNMLPQVIAQILTESGFEGGNLRLEVTESTIMENILTASSVLFDIKTMGVQVYLDDFGTGYSSLNYLHKFPVDALKIDPSFTRNIREDKQAMEILKSVFKLANSLDMKMIIEGVESQEALSVFRDLDFQFLQGFLFSKPVPQEKLFALMNKSRFIVDATL